MLQQIGLVHMNGRVYDSQIAHFMSADILVSHPFSSQAWNGYSYVGNNPLNRVDPSGWQDVSYQLPEVDVIQPIRPPVVRGGGATDTGAGGVAMCSGSCGSGNTGSGYSYGGGDAWNPMDDFSSHIGWGQSAMDYHNRTVSQLMGGGAWAGFRIAIPTLPVVLPHQSLFSPPPVLTPLADAAGLIAGSAWDDIGTTSGATTLATATGAYQYASGHMMEPGLEAPLIDPIDLLTGGVLAKGIFKAASLFAFRKVETLAAEEEMITLYRGVDSAHPGYSDALSGIAKPRGGTASINEHVFGGNTASPYTSWTTDFGTAESFATKESGTGVVLSNSFPNSSLIPSPGNAAGMGEFEYLIQGPIGGADVMKVPAW